MAIGIDEFGKTATVLTRNPLGIIALFIVLVYGFACIVTVSASSFLPTERAILVYLITLFPVFVLIVFTMLVMKHSGKLFAPSDFKNEDNYIKVQLSAVASLTAATSRRDDAGSEQNLRGIVAAVSSAATTRSAFSKQWKKTYYGLMIGLIIIFLRGKLLKRLGLFFL